jgi:hypothetical protein
MLVADNMSLTNGSAAVNAGTNIATLRPFENGTIINLGAADAANTLGLTDAELDKVTAGVLRVGNVNNTGVLSVTQPITQAGGGYTTLTLLNGGNILETGSGVLAQTNLGVQGGGVNLPAGGNAITNLGGTATGSFLTAFFLNNSTPLNIADVDTFNGLVVIQGGIDVINNGTISLTSIGGLQAVTGGTNGTVSLLANGATADVIRPVDGDAISNPGGDVQVQAGRDILFGTAGTDFDNDVRANRGIFLTAGRDVTIDGFTDVAADDFGNNTGVGVHINAGRNVNITDNHGDDASVGANGTAGANVVILVGPNGTLTLSAPSSSAIFSNSGYVTIVADRVKIDNASGITASAGTVTILQSSGPWNIDLGSTTDVAANTLELSDAELDRIFSPTLIVGDEINNGNINITAAISPANATTLSLLSSGNIQEGISGQLTVMNLQAQGSLVLLSTATNAVMTLAGSASANAGTSFLFADSVPLTIGVVVGVNGVTTTQGGIDIGTPGDLTVATRLIAGGPAHTITLTSSDNIIVNPGSLVQATGVITLNIGFSDANGIGGGTIRGTVNGPSVTVQGGTADDILLVDFTGGAALPNGLSYNGGAGNNFLMLSDQGGASAHTYTTQSAQPIVQRDAKPFPVTNVQNITLTGGNASDTFNVTPNAGITYNVNGNNPVPPASPGDTLNINTTGTTNLGVSATGGPNGFQGSYTFGNRQPVNFTGIETLNPPLPTISIDDVAVVEGNAGSTNAVFTVTLSASNTQAVMVDYTTSNGTATAPSDYQSVNGTLNFPPGTTTRNVSVPVNGDTIPEGDETFFVNLSNANNASITDNQGKGTITDDDAGGTLAFSAASYNVNENAGTITITVNRTGSTVGAVTVNYATSNGTATAGSDYGNTAGTLFFGSGETSKTFDVPIINDTLSEGTETVNLALSLPTGGATLGTQNTATILINDDEAPPPPDIFAVTTNNHLLKFNANAPDTIVSDTLITGLQGGENVLNIDFRPATGQLYAVGSTSRLYTINTSTSAATQVGSSGAFTLSGTDFGADFNPTVDRLRVVSDIEQNIRLNPNDGTLTATDTPLAYAPSDPNFGANPNVTGSAYTNNFAGASATTLYDIDSNLGVLVRQGGVDGAAPSPNGGQLFTVGPLGVNTTGLTGFDIRSMNNTGYASLTSPGDTSSKLYTVNLSTGATTLVGTIGGAQLIRDIALAPAGSFQFSTAATNVSEGAGKLTVTINRTGDTTGTANVNVATADGTATQKGDYTIRLAQITFNPGETSKTVDVFITDDGYVEGPESFTIGLSSPTGDFTLDGTSTQTVTITDNDAVASNPIATVPFFVRQHYIDFLNREPDPPGFAGWQNILNTCAPGNTSCDRVEVSSAFYRSDEFQVRGYFLYRFYRASLARNPTFREFMMDLSRTTGFLTDAQLEAAKVAFVNDFMARQEFRTKYDAATDPSAYVSLIEQTAGVTLSNRQTLITGLQNGTETRATVLRKAMESTEVAGKFFNEAFVVEAYFRYLRRDPDGAFTGWVNLLNSTNDRRVIVNGFVNSNEYVQRFGP